MQHKIISPPEWSSVILPESGTSFSTVSPVKIINSNPYFAFTWAGIHSCVSGSSIPVGTVYACRYGSYGQQRIKTYEWLIYGKDNEFLIQDVTEKDKIPDHHTEGTPIMFHNAPKEIRSLFNK